MIRPDNTVVVISKHLDKGQGAATGLATLVADELDASIDPDRGRARAVQSAGLREFPVRHSGNRRVHGDRQFLHAVPPGGRRRQGDDRRRRRQVLGRSRRRDFGRRWCRVAWRPAKSATLGELAGLAAQEAVPAEPVLKTPDQWVYIGKSFRRVDTANKTVGAPKTYTMDFQRDDLLVAVIARSPRFGGKVKSFDATEAMKVKGVVNVLQVPTGVAVIADIDMAGDQGARSPDGRMGRQRSRTCAPRTR